VGRPLTKGGGNVLLVARRLKCAKSQGTDRKSKRKKEALRRKKKSAVSGIRKKSGGLESSVGRVSGAGRGSVGKAFAGSEKRERVVGERECCSRKEV